MILKYFLFVLLYYLYHQINQCHSLTMTYISTEHPEIYWYDRKYLKNFTLVNKRWTRKDPRHYMSVYLETLFPADNNVQLDYYIYQFLTNRYRPSFVEMHFKLCNLVNDDSLLGEPLRKALGGRFCPYPPGVYDLRNMTIPYIPKGFPFNKGRVYFNATLTVGSVTKLITNASMDIELKVVRINKN